MCHFSVLPCLLYFLKTIAEVLFFYVLIPSKYLFGSDLVYFDVCIDLCLSDVAGACGTVPALVAEAQVLGLLLYGFCSK